MQPITDLNEAAREQRSRRAMLAGVIGGLGAFAATAIAKATPVEAAAGDPIRMGQLNKAGGTQTRLQTSSTGEAYLVDQRGTGAGLRIAARGTALQADVTHSATAVAVKVASTGHGMAISAYGFGLAVQADGGVGVSATTEDAPAVLGLSNTIGVSGYSNDGTGVRGEVEQGFGVVGVANGHDSIGVAGIAHGDASSAGSFDGTVQISGVIEVTEPGVPFPAPRADLFVRKVDGKVQLCVRWGGDDPVQVIATQP